MTVAHRRSFLSLSGLIVLLLGQSVHGFVVRHQKQPNGRLQTSKILSSTQDSAQPEVVSSSSLDPEAVRLKDELLELGSSTKRGFKASNTERRRARDIIFDLARFNPTAEPLSPYYENTTNTEDDTPTLAGKWTLVYTDAPDITGLDAAGPFSTAKLDRIGQECKPPTIKNVIEWRRPDWAENLPFSGTAESRVLQKVVTEGTASPDKPFIMNLKLVGIELESDSGTSGSGSLSLQESISENGLPAALLQANPVELRGPLTAPFGMFEVLYLDDQMRIVKTGQNFLAVNVRPDVEWF